MYTVASNNFILLECGDGMSMFEGAKVVSDTGILDVEILENYIVNNLNRVISEKYEDVDRRITFTEGIIIEQPEITDEDDNKYGIWIATISGILAVTTVATLLIIRKKRK